MAGWSFRLASSTRSALHLTRFKSRWGARNLHKAPALPYPIDGGLGEFLPPAALKVVAGEYQEGLLERLNDEVRGTEHQNATLVDTIINIAGEPEYALAFNYASLALNNGYFLDHLKPPAPGAPHHQNEISSQFAQAIREQHGSLAQLKSTCSAAATGLFSNGWIWFVSDAGGNTGILPTLGPSTLLIRSRTYTGHEDWLHTLTQATYSAPATEDMVDAQIDADEIARMHQDEGEDWEDEHSLSSSPTARPSPPGGAPQSPVSGVSGARNPDQPNIHGPKFMHTSARSSQQQTYYEQGGEEEVSTSEESIYARNSIYEDPIDIPTEPMSKVRAFNKGDVLYPLFCIPVYEHAWMAAGYGVWGKEEWLKKFWSVLDWQKISAQYESIHQDPYRISA